MEYKIIFLESALEDIDNVVNYNYSVSLIFNTKFSEKKLKKKIMTEVERLSISPKKCARIGKFDRYKNEYRRMVLGKDVLLYVVDDKEKVVYISHYFSRKNQLS